MSDHSSFTDSPVSPGGSNDDMAAFSENLATCNDQNLNPNSNRPKRHTACELCRRRKLKCNGQKPRCETCVRLNKECQYTTLHKKSGPQRGYLKKLETRLEQMEQLLAKNIAMGQNKNTQDLHFGNKRQAESEDSDDGISRNEDPFKRLAPPRSKQPFLTESEDVLERMPSNFVGPKDYEGLAMEARRVMAAPSGTIDLFNHTNAIVDDQVPTKVLMPMNVEEPYPSEAVINQLVDQYFESLHTCYPFISRPRFCSMISMGRVKPYLLYAVLMTGASLSDNQFFQLQDQMYQRALKYLYKAETRGYGEEIVNLEYVQAAVLLAIHENRIGCFGRAWMTVGKAVKAAHQNNLHDVEASPPLFSKYASNTPDTPLIKDEKRRTFWCVYLLDKYCAVGTGWPAGVRESEIRTNLPLDDAAFGNSIPETSAPFYDLLENPEIYLKGIDSTLALSAVFAYFLSQAFNLMNKNSRPDDNQPTGQWWTTEQRLSNQITRISRLLPPISMDPSNPQANNTAISLQLFFNTSVLALNRAAIIKLKSQTGPFNPREFKMKCQRATSNVVQVLRMCNNLFKVVIRNPCGLFCLYTTARSFITILEEDHAVQDISGSFMSDGSPNTQTSSQLRSQLDFLLTVVNVLKSKMFMAECFYEKLQADILSAKLSRSTGPITQCQDFISKMQKDAMKAEVFMASKPVEESQQDPASCTYHSGMLTLMGSQNRPNSSISSDGSVASTSPDSFISTPNPTTGYAGIQNLQSFTFQQQQRQQPKQQQQSVQSKYESDVHLNLNPKPQVLDDFKYRNQVNQHKAPMFHNKDILFQISDPVVVIPDTPIPFSSSLPISQPQLVSELPAQSTYHKSTESVNAKSDVISDPTVIDTDTFSKVGAAKGTAEDFEMFFSNDLNDPNFLQWNSELSLESMIRSIAN